METTETGTCPRPFLDRALRGWGEAAFGCRGPSSSRVAVVAAVAAAVVAAVVGYRYTLRRVDLFSFLTLCGNRRFVIRRLSVTVGGPNEPRVLVPSQLRESQLTTIPTDKIQRQIFDTDVSVVRPVHSLRQALPQEHTQKETSFSPYHSTVVLWCNGSLPVPFRSLGDAPPA